MIDDFLLIQDFLRIIYHKCLILVQFLLKGVLPLFEVALAQYADIAYELAFLCIRANYEPLFPNTPALKFTLTSQDI